MDGAAVHRLQAEAAGTTEDHVRNGDGVVAAGGLGAELDAGGGAAGVGGNLLVGGKGACQHGAGVIAADGAVLDDAVFYRLEDTCAVGGLKDDGVIGQGVEPGVADGDVLGAVDVEGVAVGVHGHVVHQHVLAALGDNGKVAAVQHPDAVQHDALAAHQRDTLVAVPGGDAAAAVGGVARLVAHQHLIQLALVVHLTAVNQAFAVDHDVLFVGGIEQAVGKVGVAAVLQTGIQVNLGLVVVARGAVGIMILGLGDDAAAVQVCLGGLDHCALGQVEVDIVQQTDGVGAEGALRDHDGAAARVMGGLDSLVDGLGVGNGVGAGVSGSALLQGHGAILADVVPVRLLFQGQQLALGHVGAAGQLDAAVLREAGQVNAVLFGGGQAILLVGGGRTGGHGRAHAQHAGCRDGSTGLEKLSAGNAFHKKILLNFLRFYIRRDAFFTKNRIASAAGQAPE